jgi:hypothetical protein
MTPVAEVSHMTDSQDQAHMVGDGGKDFEQQKRKSDGHGKYLKTRHCEVDLTTRFTIVLMKFIQVGSQKFTDNEQMLLQQANTLQNMVIPNLLQSWPIPKHQSGCQQSAKQGLHP